MKASTKIIKTGSYFPVSAKGAMSITCLPIFFVLYNYELIGTDDLPYDVVYISMFFLVVSSIVFFAKSSLEIDLVGKKYKKLFLLFGLKMGSWKSFDDLEAIGVKYVNLVAKNRFRTVAPIAVPGVGVGGGLYNNQYTSDQQWWLLVKFYNKEPFKLYAGDREIAIELINYLLDIKDVPTYSGVFIKNREIHSDKIRKGEILFIRNPKTKGRR